MVSTQRMESFRPSMQRGEYNTMSSKLSNAERRTCSTPAEVLHQLMDTEATFIFVQPELVPVLEQALSMAPPTYNIKPEHILLLCERENIPEGIPYQCITDAWHRQARPRQITDDRDKDTVFICYSSGTGGPPKGVEITHHNMASQLQAVNALYEPLSWKNDKVLAVLPFSHIYGLTLLVHHPLMRGAATVVLPKFDPVQIFQTIQKVCVHEYKCKVEADLDISVSNHFHARRPSHDGGHDESPRLRHLRSFIASWSFDRCCTLFARAHSQI